MKKLLYTVASLTLFAFLYNGSMMDSSSTGSSKIPDINFYGTLEDHHRTADVQFITIGGRYKQIPVYQPIKLDHTQDKQTIDPKQNIMKLDLKEVRSIELKHPLRPSQSTVKLNGREYITIIVTSITGSSKEYMIETSRRITCQEIDRGTESKSPAVKEERELTFLHVRKLTLLGYKKAVEGKTPDLTHMAEPTEKQQEFNKTATILDKIEKNVKDLPKNNPTLFEQMRKTLLTLLKSLRAQLQKLVNLIQ